LEEWQEIAIKSSVRQRSSVESANKEEEEEEEEGATLSKLRPM